MAAAQATGCPGDNEWPNDAGVSKEAGGEVGMLMGGRVDVVEDPGMAAIGQHVNVGGCGVMLNEAESTEGYCGRDLLGEGPRSHDADEEGVSAVHQLICLQGVAEGQGRRGTI